MQARCDCASYTIEDELGRVARVRTCPVCVGRLMAALAELDSQLDLFFSRGGASVSAVVLPLDVKLRDSDTAGGGTPPSELDLPF